MNKIAIVIIIIINNNNYYQIKNMNKNTYIILFAKNLIFI